MTNRLAIPLITLIIILSTGLCEVLVLSLAAAYQLCHVCTRGKLGTLVRSPSPGSGCSRLLGRQLLSGSTPASARMLSKLTNV